MDQLALKNLSFLHISTLHTYDKVKNHSYALESAAFCELDEKKITSSLCGKGAWDPLVVVRSITAVRLNTVTIMEPF
jgi:hypothetical protein